MTPRKREEKESQVFPGCLPCASLAERRTLRLPAVRSKVTEIHLLHNGCAPPLRMPHVRGRNVIRVPLAYSSLRQLKEMPGFVR